MVDFVHPIGTILILVAVLVIFLIVTDPRFIDRCKAFGAWIVAKLARKPKEQEDTDDTVEDTGLTIDIPVSASHSSPIKR